jgi:predicted nucleic acid-binding protein
MQYVDTSRLVAALLNEKSTAAAQRWLGGQPAGELAISDWVITEFSAAPSMKLCTGELEPLQRNEVLAFFTRLTEASLNEPVEFSHPTGLRYLAERELVSPAWRGYQSAAVPRRPEACHHP